MFTNSISRAVKLSVGVKSSERAFHVTSRTNLSRAEKKFKNVEKKKKNIAFKNSVESKKEKVDPVLGKANNAFIQRLKLETNEPNILTKGYTLSNVDKLLFGAKEVRLQKIKEINPDVESLEKTEKEENEKRNILLRILTLRNADNDEKHKKLTELAIKEFQRFDGDTGSSEVQAAVMTIEIYNLMDHIKKNPQDLLHIRKVRMLTQKRQRILRYLKKDNAQKYFWTIEKLGLTDESVFMEFNMDRKYMDEFEIWPGRQLVKLNKRENEEIKKKRRLEKQSIRRALQNKNAERELNQEQ
jgi:small subunit ribosomal protein S15